MDPAARYTSLQVLQHPWVHARPASPDSSLPLTVLPQLRSFQVANKLAKEDTKQAAMAGIIPKKKSDQMTMLVKAVRVSSACLLPSCVRVTLWACTDYG